MLRIALFAGVLAFGCHTTSTGPGPGPEPAPAPAPTPAPAPAPAPAPDPAPAPAPDPSPAPTPAPTATECPKKKCGPVLGMKSTPCSDGSMGGPTGRCIEHADKTCGWEIHSCP